MAKKAAKKGTTKQRVTTAEAEAAHLEASLRRMQRQQIRIAELGRAVRRATRRADVARLQAARELCADTDFAVFLIDEVGKTQREVYERDDMIDALRKRLAEVEGYSALATLTDIAELREHLRTIEPPRQLSEV